MDTTIPLAELDSRPSVAQTMQQLPQHNIEHNQSQNNDSQPQYQSLLVPALEQLENFGDNIEDVLNNLQLCPNEIRQILFEEQPTQHEICDLCPSQAAHSWNQDAQVFMPGAIHHETSEISRPINPGSPISEICEPGSQHSEISRNFGKLDKLDSNKK